ncbi:hypothetical protein CTI12_AA342820 [Artemisia annua]|uniref:MULE transposase domain-containing protein n=1 Tax=Artemisia annua TaxID=35608 RepID=A0A2U1MT73_ARTAN|nr:hypothetical protein CTI12_AA342820 [Artemisia annua]
MDDSAEISIDQSSRPVWENIVESSILEQPSTKYKLNVQTWSASGKFMLISCKMELRLNLLSMLISMLACQAKTMTEAHTCIRSNKGGNKHATQGWIAEVVSDKLKSSGDVYVIELSKWLMQKYSIVLQYHKVFRGKEQAYNDIYGKWEDSFIRMDDFKEELRNRNPESVVEIGFETDGDKKRFQRFFISLVACSMGFLAGCRPYISLDACHLKGKFNGVLVAATGIDACSMGFLAGCRPYISLDACHLKGKFNGVLVAATGIDENTNSWTWFLESLKKAVGTPYGLVISSDMQKGLEGAIMQVYPSVEHRECIRHLYSNFKKNESEEAVTYLHANHKKIWSRSKFGTTSKCDYITNNISETFNSWVGDLRYKPVLDLLDGIREMLMVRFHKKRKVAVCASSDNRAEVKYKGKRWEVILVERKCTSAFIAFIRDNNWDKYVDPYFTVTKFKEAYALEIGPLPTKDQWVHMETEEKIYPPFIKRPAGRPRKNRIVPHDESKRRHKCPRCNEYGHHSRTCKNPAFEPSQSSNKFQASTSKRKSKLVSRWLCEFGDV